ncbi:hypothetical protein PFISCL1PPCAC_20508, partial [Pristionchus fissidentatus]
LASTTANCTTSGHGRIIMGITSGMDQSCCFHQRKGQTVAPKKETGRHTHKGNTRKVAIGEPENGNVKPGSEPTQNSDGEVIPSAVQNSMKPRSEGDFDTEKKDDSNLATIFIIGACFLVSTIIIVIV